MKEIVIRIQIPEGVPIGTPQVDYTESEPPLPIEPGHTIYPKPDAHYDPASAAGATSGKPRCPLHGSMTFKEGVNKQGKPYAGWFCTTEGCETKPIWQRLNPR